MRSAASSRPTRENRVAMEASRPRCCPCCRPSPANSPSTITGSRRCHRRPFATDPSPRRDVARVRHERRRPRLFEMAGRRRREHDLQPSRGGGRELARLLRRRPAHLAHGLLHAPHIERYWKSKFSGHGAVSRGRGQRHPARVLLHRAAHDSSTTTTLHPPVGLLEESTWARPPSTTARLSGCPGRGGVALRHLHVDQGVEVAARLERDQHRARGRLR